MLRIPALVALMLVIAACGTPEERCLRRAQPDTAVLDAQIAETRANIERGYALKRSNVTLGVGLCSQSGPVNLCLGGSGQPPPRAVPIDVQTEKARLAALYDRRAQIVAASERAMAVCRAGV